jgi:hypothetical protein
MKSNLVNLAVEIVHETEKAVLVHDGDKSKAVWLPKSAVEISRNDPTPGIATITLPEPLAIEKGLV